MTTGGQIIIPYGDTPTTPPPIGKIAIYTKSSADVYYMADDGTEYVISSSSGIGGFSHSDLVDLTYDTHPQYHNDARGDDRYYTQDGIDGMFTTISGQLLNISGQIPTDFYTTSEVIELIATTSGIIQDKINEVISEELKELDVVYLTYSGTNGTQSGESGCTLLSPGNWSVTKSNTIYFIEPYGGSVTVTIPDSDASNEGTVMVFRKPLLADDCNTITIKTESMQNVGKETTLVLRRSGENYKIIANNFGSLGVSDRRWRVINSNSFIGKSIVVAANGGDFTNLQPAINYVRDEVSGDSNFVIEVKGDIYEVASPIVVNTSKVRAIIGVTDSATVFKPTEEFALDLANGAMFMELAYTTDVVNMTLDATDYPSLETSVSGTGVYVSDDSYNELLLKNINILGFRRGIFSDTSSNIYTVTCDIRKCGTAVHLTGDDQLFDADLLYIEDCWDKHVHVSSGEAYFASCEFNSANTVSGVAIYVEGDGTYVEFFAGTNVWSCSQNIIVTGGAEVKVDNCVLEETGITPGIIQESDSFLTIINSRAHLGQGDISIATPVNCYISSFDSDSYSIVTGNGSQTDQTIFSFANGATERPTFNYHPAHNVDYRALSFENHVEYEKSEFFVSSNNGNTSLGIHPIGDNAFNNESHLGLVSIQNNVRSGWMFRKMSGTTPQFKLHNKNNIDAVKIEYDGTFSLLSGTGVNSILDEDDFSSNDALALATQQSIKTYVDNRTYTSSELDYGQLDSRYYTEAEVDATISGYAAAYIKRDGSSELTSNWNAGEYEISAGGFRKGDVDLDLAGFANITGILNGGEISINSVDNTMLDVEAGKGIMVDMSDRDDPSVEVVYWDAATVSTTLSGVRTKWIGVEKASPGVGSIIVQTNFTQPELRHTIVLGKCWGNGTDTITGTGNYKSGAFSFGKSMQDIAYSIGSINVYGNSYSPTVSGSMLLSRSAGESFRFGANYSNDELSPNIYQSTSQSGISNYQYHIQGQLYTNTETEIDPNYYDLSGVKTILPEDKWSAQFIYYFPVSNTTHVVYAQHYHDSLAECYDDISNYSPVLNSAILEGSILRSIIILKKGCDDLTDPLQAKFTTTIGIGASGASTGGGITDHGSLGGLGDDDHQQYMLYNGARNFSSKVSYNSHPTFDSDTNIIDKKYVDDSLSAFSSDHGQLSGLTDDDHQQYHNDARGDARYYTQTQVDTIATTLESEFAAYSTLATVQVHRTDDLVLTTGYQNIIFNVLDVETDSTVIEMDDVNTERFLIKVSGTYRMDYVFSARTSGATRYVYARLTTNGTTEIPGSSSLQDLYPEETHQQVGSCVANLTAGSYVTVQVMAASTPVTTLAGHSFRIIKLDGIKGADGEDGAPGSGSTIIIKEDGTNLSNTPHSAINFIGDGVTAVDAGGGVTDVTISMPSTSSFGTEYSWVSDEAETSTNSTSFQQKLTLPISDIPSAYYRVGWYYEWKTNSTSYDFMSRVVVDDTVTVMEQNEETKDTLSWHTESGFVVTQLTLGSHFFDIDCCSESSNMTVYVRRAILEIWRVA